MAYCQIADLYAYGLQRGAFSNPGRLAQTANAASNTITLDQHGFSLNDLITLRVEGGGVLPAPLVAGVGYYVIPVGESAFSLAATFGGGAIDLTTAGSRMIVTIPVSRQAAIDWATALIDDLLPAHIVPLSAPINPSVVMTCAELAIGKLMQITGSGSKSIGDMVDAARKRLERWSAGVPLRGANVPPPANVAASATVPFLDSRGFSKFGGL